MWTPCKFREACTREDIKQREAKQLELEKADTKKLKAAATLYNKKIAEEKRVAREEAKVVREKEQAEKAAQIAAKKAANNTKKSILTA
jgi:hypothetical protein